VIGGHRVLVLIEHRIEITTAELLAFSINLWELVRRVELEQEAGYAITMLGQVLPQAHARTAQVVAGELLQTPAFTDNNIELVHVLDLAVFEEDADLIVSGSGKLLLKVINVASAALRKVLAPPADEVVGVGVVVQPAPIPRQPHRTKE
jgi:hypothetical protein